MGEYSCLAWDELDKADTRSCGAAVGVGVATCVSLQLQLQLSLSAPVWCASSRSMSNLNCSQPELRQRQKQRLTSCNTCSGLRTEAEFELRSLCLQVIGLPVLVVLIKALSLCREICHGFISNNGHSYGPQLGPTAAPRWLAMHWASEGSLAAMRPFKLTIDLRASVLRT